MRIVIVGLGVIGGGYAMALKEAGYSEVYGVDKNIETLKKAKALGIIKEGYEDGKDIIQSADLIVLAIYPNLVKDFIIKNKEYFKDGTIITDVRRCGHCACRDGAHPRPSGRAGRAGLRRSNGLPPADCGHPGIGYG